MRLRILIVLVLSCMSVELCCASQGMPKRKKLLVLSSKGGGGHAAACMAVSQFVGDEYDIKVIHPIDQLRIWGVPACERVYNAMLQRGWIRSMNFLARFVAPRIFSAREQKIEEMITSYLKSYQPDLIISLIPYVNYPASEAARKMHKPYLLITTDNDLYSWVLGLEKVKNPHFKVTIGADLPSTLGLLHKKNIPDTAIEVTGHPLRAEFCEEKNVDNIRREWGFTSEKPVVLIMMGGTGNAHALQYARIVGALDMGVHLLVVTGRSDKLKRAIDALPLHPSNERTVIGYTNRVADLMAISDLLITKPGPGTISEALSMQLPMFIDTVGISLFWERVNIDLVTKYNVGQRIEDYVHLFPLMKEYLHDAERKKALACSFVSIPKNTFHLRIKKLIDEMVEDEHCALAAQ